MNGSLPPHTDNLHRNRFREALNSGGFVILVENSIGRDGDPAAAAEKLAALEQNVLAIRNFTAGIAVTDAWGHTESRRTLECLASLSRENKDRHVVYVSGRDTDEDKLAALLRFACDTDIRNLVAVSGNAVYGESVKDTRKRRFTESVRTLSVSQNDYNEKFFCGCVTNPFRYEAYSLLGQYCKLVRKIRAGAQFVVVQAGWDMLKLQSLRWYLSIRGFYVPTVARLLILTPEKVEKILAGHEPGVCITADFQKILAKELRFSLNQFESAQWRRLELQAAGCKLLGYSGIQLTGIDSPHRLSVAIERINAAMQEFTTFEQWLDEYNVYLAHAELAPSAKSFYLFDRTLHRAYPETTPRMTQLEKPQLSRTSRLSYHVRHFLFPHADRQDASSRHLLKVILCGCRGCNHCRLSLCEYICPEQCPKRLANGPCGGVRQDGTCELGGRECVHIRIMRIAHWRGEITTMEDRILPHGQ